MNKWSEDELQYLKDNYKKNTSKELAKELGRTITSVEHKKSRLGLRVLKKYNPIEQGNIFGEWTVLYRSFVDKRGNAYYKCKCSCGNTKEVRGTELKSRTSTSCGGFRHFDLTGNIFGELKVVSFSHRDKYNNSYYICHCSCGNTKIIKGSSLVEKKTKTCGKRDHRNLINERFSDWHVVEFSHIDKHSNSYYICECSCGKTKIVRGKHLISGMSTSCGCSTEYRGEVAIRQYFKSKPCFIYKEQETYKGLFFKSKKNELISDGTVYDKSGNLLFVIEYDGIQHYEYRPFFHKTEDDFEEQKVKDYLKDEYCKNKNIYLLRVPYWEYNNINKVLDNYIDKKLKIRE